MLVGIIGLGLVSAYLLRSMDHDYSDLIDRSVPVLNEMRALSTSALSAQRSLLAGLLAEDDSRRAVAYTRVQAFIDTGRHIRRALGDREIFQSSGTALKPLDRAGSNYEEAVEEFLALAKNHRMTEAQAWRRAKVKPALDLYLTQLEIAARYVEDRSQKISDDYSDVARSRSAILIGFASLPILIGSIMLIVVVVVIVGMILIFRRVGVDDAN